MTDNHGKSMDIDRRVLRFLAVDSRQSGLYPAPDELQRHRQVEEVLNRCCQTDATMSRRRHLARWRRRAGAVAVALMVSGVGYGIWRLGTPVESVEERGVSSTVSRLAAPEVTSPPVDRLAGSRFTLLNGNIPPSNLPISLGDNVPLRKWIETHDGVAAFALPRGIAVGMNKETSLRVLVDASGTLEVEMASGTALFSVNPAIERDGFVVRTPMGRIRVTGTLFSVATRAPDEVAVFVHHGSVVVTSREAEAVTVVDGTGAVMSRKGVATVANLHWPDVAVQPAFFGCLDGAGVFSELADASCLAADTEQRSKETSSSSREPSRMVVQRSIPSASSHTETPTPADLLERARRARRDGDHASMAGALRGLIARYPTLPDSRTALITLGHLELRHLGNPGSALDLFNRYLQRHGPLTEEALQGRAMAQAKLGDAAGERRTLRELVRRFPDGAAAHLARTRLGQ